MDTVTIKLLRARLETERARLQRELLNAGVPASEERREGSPFGKREEEATEALELEKRLALVKRTRAELAEIEHAMSKFDSGRYGICEVCNKAIDPARLEALPQAALCLSCKSQQTRTTRT